MRFIKNALIGIALYEAVKYFLRKDDCDLKFAGQLSKENSRLNTQDLDDDFFAATDPETPLRGESPVKAADDPWKNSLANDDLRAPDS
jgi:hypothetical protein